MILKIFKRTKEFNEMEEKMHVDKGKRYQFRYKKIY